MPMKGSGEATEYREIDRREHGVGWIAYPSETMQRASHAFEVDGEVWVVDPVDVDSLDDLLAEFGEVAGVVTLLDRHKRDAATIANRHDVAVSVPTWMDGVAPELDAPVDRVHSTLGDTGCRIHRLIDNRFWQEAALSIDVDDTLLVPESVGTASYFRTSGERLGVHPMVRLFPPSELRRFSPERVLVCHGDGVHDDTSRALADAVSNARRRTPRLYGQILKNTLVG